MKLVVCIKQVPDSNEIALNADLTLERRYTARIMNPADESALEWALETRDRLGGEVTVVSMGPMSVESTLREALSRGADRAVLLSSPHFAGADTLITARCLAAAVRALGGADIICCGRRATDGETGQVGPMLAALMDIPCVPNAVFAEAGAHVTVCQLTEEGKKTWSSPCPMLLTFCEWSYPLRLPTLALLRKAAKMPIEVLAPEDIGLTYGECGLTASPTRVKRVVAVKSGARPCRKLPVDAVLDALEKAGDIP